MTEKNLRGSSSGVPGDDTVDADVGVEAQRRRLVPRLLEVQHLNESTVGFKMLSTDPLATQLKRTRLQNPEAFLEWIVIVIVE